MDEQLQERCPYRDIFITYLFTDKSFLLWHTYLTATGAFTSKSIVGNCLGGLGASRLKEVMRNLKEAAMRC